MSTMISCTEEVSMATESEVWLNTIVYGVLLCRFFPLAGVSFTSSATRATVRNYDVRVLWHESLCGIGV